MIKTIIRKIYIYRKKKLRKNMFTNKKISKNLNNLNPFAYNKHNSSILDNLVMLMNTTPEEDAASMQRVMNMVKCMVYHYREEKINDNVSKFIHRNNEEDYYYEVEKIKMNQEQYQQYLDKKALNEKLNKKLPLRKKEKQAKL